MVKVVLAAVTLAALSGCMTPSQPAAGGVAPAIQVETGTEFTLTPGQTALIKGAATSIRFVGVNNDSRCPTDVTCVWAGNAAVLLRLTHADATSDRVVNTTLDPKVVRTGEYVISLVRVEPAPRSGSTIPAADYKVTLSASRD